MAPIYQQLIAAFQAGDLKTARRWQMLSIQIIAVMARYGGLPAGKAMMKLVGLDCGPVRPPLQNLTPEEFEAFRQDLERMGFPAQALILIRFQDEANSGRVGAWQDHAGLIHSSLSGRK